MSASPIRCILLCAFLLLIPRLQAAATAADWVPPHVAAVILPALTNSPRLQVAAEALEAARQRALAADGFYEPQVTAAGGWNDRPTDAPATLLSAGLPGDAATVQSGIVLPLRPGLRLGVGAAQRYLLDDDGDRDRNLSVAGVRLQVPLLRDRGFLSQDLRQAAADEETAIASEAAAVEHQAVLRDLLVAAAALAAASADVRQAGQAAERVTRLRDQTADRVALATTAEYQLFPARMQVALRQEEQRRADAALTNARHRVEELLAAPLPAAMRISPDLLTDWAGRCSAAASRIPADGRARPELRQAARLVAAAELQARLAREQARSDLSLNAGVGYQTERDTDDFGTATLPLDDTIGLEAALVWRRPWAFDAEAATLAAAEAELRASVARLRQVRLRVDSEVAQASEALNAAFDRRLLAETAVTEARLALSAEEERLRLGEGRSSDVLDAQKDLTDSERRANSAALDTITAFANSLFAAGAPLLPAPGE